MTHGTSATLMCAVYSQFLGKSLTLAAGHSGIISTLAPIPRTSRYERGGGRGRWGTALGMLLMSEPEGIPSCWMLGPRFLKDSTSKMRHMEVSHAAVPRVETLRLKCHADRFKTGYEPDASMFIADGGML